ncbi:MAG: FAD-dependent oxidoreductase [Pseudomonadota bacterium]
MTTLKSSRIGVVGAGLAGLVVAEGLARAGARVRVFEKSRGVAGRLSTRRVREAGPAEGLEFDHGAPALHGNSGAFEAFLSRLADAGSVAPWRADIDAERAPSEAMVGTPRMNAALAPLTAGLDIQLRTTVKAVTSGEDGCRVRYEDADGEAFEETFDRIVIAAPAPQTAVIAAAVPEIAEAANASRYHPCWTVMAAVTGAGLPKGAGAGGAIAALICNNAKPGRDAALDGRALTTWVAHATPEWTEAHLEESREDVLAQLTPELLERLGAAESDVAYVTAHRWRYARVATPLGRTFAANTDETVFAVGDWCLGADAGCAYDSALALLAVFGRTSVA